MVLGEFAGLAVGLDGKGGLGGHDGFSWVPVWILLPDISANGMNGEFVSGRCRMFLMAPIDAAKFGQGFDP